MTFYMRMNMTIQWFNSVSPIMEKDVWHFLLTNWGKIYLAHQTGKGHTKQIYVR
jgi:hypothetical protein